MIRQRSSPVLGSARQMNLRGRLLPRALYQRARWPPESESDDDVWQDAIAARGLPGSAVAASKLCAPGTWGNPVDAAAAGNLLGLLDKMCREGAVELGPTDTTRLADLLSARLAGDLIAERRMVIVVDALVEAGVRFAVFKGSANAHRFESDPSLRHFDDVDILVDGSDLARTFQVVRQFGGHRLYPEPRPGFDVQFGKGATFLTDDLGYIDVHRMVAPGWVGLELNRLGLLQDPSHFAVAGRAVPTLSPTYAALVAAVRCIAGDEIVTPRLLRDAVLGWSAPGVDHDEMVSLALRTGTAMFVAGTVRTATRRFTLGADTALSQWAHAFQPNDRDLRRMAPYAANTWSYPMQLIQMVPAIHGWKNRVRYLWALGFPVAGSGRARGLQRLSTLRGQHPRGP